MFLGYMIEVDPIAIIQIDATVITGILILLTITKSIRATDEFWLHKGVTSVVIPFGLSALLSIWGLLISFSPTPEGNFIPISLIMMFVGFLYLIAVIIKFTTKKNSPSKSH